jgi:hypothetical protein
MSERCSCVASPAKETHTSPEIASVVRKVSATKVREGGLLGYGTVRKKASCMSGRMREVLAASQDALIRKQTSL